MESYNKITRLHKYDKHVLHKYEAEFLEFSPESIIRVTPKDPDIISLNDLKNTAAYEIRHRISL